VAKEHHRIYRDLRHRVRHHPVPKNSDYPEMKRLTQERHGSAGRKLGLLGFFAQSNSHNVGLLSLVLTTILAHGLTSVVGAKRSYFRLFLPQSKDIGVFDH
jgi:hypothetical protein